MVENFVIELCNFPNKSSKKRFFETFEDKDDEIDVHIRNRQYSKLIECGLVKIAGYSASDRMVLRLTSKGKETVKLNLK